MRKLLFILLIIGAIYYALGCGCPDKECKGKTILPLLTFNIQAPSHTDLVIKFERFTPDNPTRKDSLFLITGTASNGAVSKTYEYNVYSNTFFLPGYSYAILNEQFDFRDTLHQLDYVVRKEKIGCNKKPLANSYCDTYDEPHIDNLSFRFRGRQVNGGVIPDTLILK